MKIRRRFSAGFKDLKIFLLFVSLIPSPGLGQDATSETPSRSIYVGMDVSIVSARLKGFPAVYQVTAPEQSLRIGTSIGNSLRLEVPVRVVTSKSSESGGRTQIGSGLLLDVFPGRLTRIGGSAEQTGFFLGGGPLVDYDDIGDTRTQYGVVGRVGVEIPFNTVHFRVAALLEYRFEDDDGIDKRLSGVSLGLSYPLFGDESARDPLLDTRWYVQTRMGVNHTILGDETQRSLSFPKGFFGVFLFPGSQRIAALGVRTHLDYTGNDQEDASYVHLQPRAEINLLSRSDTRKGIQLGVHGIFEHLSSNPSIGRSFGASYYGGGGDISMTLPALPTIWKIGIGFDHNGAGRGRAAINNFRFDVALDRFLFGSPKPPKKKK